MKSKIFLDTNIVLDILIKKRLNHKYRKTLIDRLLDYEVYISEDMLSTFYYITKDKEKTLKFFQAVLNDWHIVPFGKNVIKSAIAYALKHNRDLEDTLQCFCAKENKCEIFLTNDKKFIDCGVKILDYEGFLKETDE
ncbi:type II toxin-antitoxin system VapC family toxin [Nitrosophilus labii]|uniref:type II toxin-antitoxin system VapC family toxin n=1 Tax=Nitrosophilus labii TaxID=2706014 RepID=UPI0018DA0913|nr:type II toxin-antitoxin system VapC family toxin [Nitrosophilus labii]